MKVSVDTEKCITAGLCVGSAETVFDQDEDTGLVKLLVTEPAAEAEAQVHEAARMCPSSAITIHDDATV